MAAIEPKCPCGASISRVQQTTRLTSPTKAVRFIYCPDCGHIYAVIDITEEYNRLCVRAYSGDMQAQRVMYALKKAYKDARKDEGEKDEAEE